MSYYQQITLNNGKKIKVATPAIIMVAGESESPAAAFVTWYELAAAANLLAFCPKGKSDPFESFDVECTNKNVETGKRIYRRRSIKEPIVVRDLTRTIYNQMTVEAWGCVNYIRPGFVFDFAVKGSQIIETNPMPTPIGATSAEPQPQQEEPAKSVRVTLGMADDSFWSIINNPAIDTTASMAAAAEMVKAEIEKAKPGIDIEVVVYGYGDIYVSTKWMSIREAAVNAVYATLAAEADWVVMIKAPTAEAVEIELTPTEGNVTAEPFAIPARSATPSAEYAQADPSEELCPDMIYAKRYALAFAAPSAEPATTQDDTAEPAELPTQKGDAATAEFAQDDKSDDLDHQLTLGSEFVFSIDGRGGAPTTAIIAKLGDGLYRADIASDPNGNYDADAILFLGEQVATIHYHAIIVSAEAINNRQPVAERIRNSGLWGANLSAIDFSWLDLRGASIEGCNLQSAEFANAQLYGTELRECDLSYTNFSGAKLTGANLSGSNLNSAYFGYASMIEADLSKCDLPFTILKSADLTRANLSGAKLHKTNLSGTDLYRADIIGTLFCEIDPPATPPNFALADLSGSVFKECLGDMILSAAKLDGVTFFDCVVPVERLFAAESINRPLIVGMMFMNYAYITARRGVFFAIENNGDKRYFLSYTNGTYADFTNIDTGDLKDHAHIVATLDAVLGNQ